MAISAKELIEKKNSILSAITESLEGLKSLSAETTASLKENADAIKSLETEQAALRQFDNATKASIKTFNKLLGLK